MQRSPQPRVPTTGRGIGVWRGFLAPFAALRGLLGLPAAWPLALVPAVVFALLELAFVLVSWRFLRPWVSALLAGGGTAQHWGSVVASWLSVLLASALGWLLAAFVAPVLSAPALERIVGLEEARLGVPGRAPLGFIREFLCGFGSLLVGSALSLPLVFGLTLLEFVFPPVAVLSTPLKLLVGAWGVAWSLFDYPMSLRGIGARARLAFMRQHAGAMLGFGLAFSLVFWLPCFGILMLPVGVAAATRLYWEIQGRS
ncbi:MAG: EI24 domain-containing protein [Polyangiaceae bacterium]